MKYSKAEVEIIVMENLDIVTLSDLSGILDDPEKLAEKLCTQDTVGNNGWNNGQCSSTTAKHYSKIEKILKELGYL